MHNKLERTTCEAAEYQIIDKNNATTGYSNRGEDRGELVSRNEQRKDCVCNGWKIASRLPLDRVG